MILQSFVMAALLATGTADAALEDALRAESFLFGDNTIVSAAKHEERESKSPSSITVITAEELSHYGSVIEALRTVPGVDIQVLSPGSTGINIRRNSDGAFSVLYLIDGRKMTLDLLGGSLIEIFPLALDDIERIEIIRGPGSSLYGAALGGVINIITKDPSKTQGFLGYAAGGNYSTGDASARWGGSAGENFRYRVTVAGDSTNSRRYSYTAKSSLRAMSRMTWAPSSQSTVDMQTGIDKTWIALDLGNSYEILQPYGFLQWDRKTAGTEFHAQASYSWMDAKIGIPLFNLLADILPLIGITTTANEDYGHIPARQNTYDAEVYFSPFTDLYRNRLTIGVHGRHSDIRSRIEIHKLLEETTAALYLQDEFSPVDAFTLLVGGRYDYNTVSKPALSPRASAVYSPATGHTIRLSYGKSFRKPDFLETQFKMVGIADAIPYSNPNLENQENTTLEAGYQFRASSFKVFLDAFSTTSTNMFELDGKTRMLINRRSTYSTYGCEVGGEGEIIPGRLTVGGAFSRIIGDDIGGMDIPNRDNRNKITVTALGHLPGGITLGAQYHFIDRKRVVYAEPTLLGFLRGSRYAETDSYSLFNAEVSYTFTHPKIEIGVNAFNILDARAYDHVERYAGSPLNSLYGGERLARTFLAFVRAEF